MPMFFSSRNLGNTPSPGQPETGDDPPILLKAVTLRLERRQVQSMLGGKSGHGRYRKWTWLICRENVQ